jgi:hypothetical protein
MISSALLLVQFFSLSVRALDLESYAPIATNGSAHKRQATSCEQTYGAGSVPCGSEESRFCYNPSAGEVSAIIT